MGGQEQNVERPGGVEERKYKDIRTSPDAANPPKKRAATMSPLHDSGFQICGCLRLILVVAGLSTVIFLGNLCFLLMVENSEASKEVQDRKSIINMYNQYLRAEVIELRTSQADLLDEVKILQKQLVQARTDLQKAEVEAESRLQILRMSDPTVAVEKVDAALTLIIVEADGKRYSLDVHWGIMAANSLVLRQKYQQWQGRLRDGYITGVKDYLRHTHQVHDASVPTLRAIVSYCYTGYLKFGEEVLPEQVIKVAHTYSIHTLKVACEVELCSSLNAGNLREMHKLAVKVDSETLLVAVLEFYKVSYDEVHDEMADLRNSSLP